MKEIDHFLTGQVERHKTPSVQYLVFNQDHMIHRFQLGFADILNQIPASDKTTYNAYSATKTFTALSVLQLAQQKKIDIYQPVKNYLAEFPYPPAITVKQLMTHSAGIPNPVPLNWIHLSDEHQTFDRNSFFKKVFLKNSKVKSKPNEKFAYSNPGYFLLGQLIEKISGVSYEEYVRENIIKPLNLTADELDFTTGSQQHAKGYHNKVSLSYFILGLFINRHQYFGKVEGKWKPFKNNYVNGAAYGGLIGTPHAFAKYLQEFLKPDSKLVPDDFKHLLFTENRTVSNKPTGMCLSWFSGHLNGNRYYSHAGGGGGYYCEIRVYPERG
ncbi:MAG TPA: serine hydrolase domain-containing protein, partial [Chitinophagales bacterium]|nr:serine hydrolase domain-containing protein [Chitinophagales bacterium]